MKYVPMTKWERLYRELEKAQHSGAEAVSLTLIQQQNATNPKADKVNDLVKTLSELTPSSDKFMQAKYSLDAAIANFLLPDREELIEHLDYLGVWLVENGHEEAVRGDAPELAEVTVLRARLLQGMEFTVSHYNQFLRVTVLGDDVTALPTQKQLDDWDREISCAAVDE